MDLINYWDLIVLDGWDWELVTKTATLLPYGTFIHDDLRFHNMITLPLFISAKFYGSDDAKYTELHVKIDEKELVTSPYIFTQDIGSTSSARSPYFTLQIYDTTNNIYVIQYSPTIIIPAKKRLEIYVHHPNIVDGAIITDSVNVKLTALILKVTDINKFIESLKKLR